jgi:hypothetical protein
MIVRTFVARQSNALGGRSMDYRRNNVRALREKVEKYRALARMVSDPETLRRILELTDELEQQARAIERGK